MSNADHEFLKKLIQSFKIESKERIQNISDLLLKLEKKTNAKDLNRLIESIYREIHTLKSSARAVNFLNIEKICQRLEDVFFIWKNNKIRPKAEDLDVIHKVNDLILTWIEQNKDQDLNIDENSKVLISVEQ